VFPTFSNKTRAIDSAFLLLKFLDHLQISCWLRNWHTLDVEWFQGRGRKVILLAIMRQISLLGCGGGVRPFHRRFLFPPPLRFAEGKQGIYGKWISRRCLRRNLSFLPRPCQPSIKYSINQFGDDPYFFGLEWPVH